MAAAFAAMNAVYGRVFSVHPAEAATPELAEELAEANAGQFVMDMHTHFLREDTRLSGFARMRESIGKLGWNTRRDCNRLKAGEYNHEPKVNTWKVIYCVSKKAGFPIPKPKIKKPRSNR